MNSNVSRVFGSTLIIAGTTIGAGMLALPLASAGIGFFPALLIMVVLWALMAYTALLMVEVHQFSDSKATLHTLAKEWLGNRGKWLAGFAMFFLFYALCAAYIAGGGNQFAQRLDALFSLNLSPTSATLLFTLIVAGVVTIGTMTVDKVNRFLFTLKIVAMAAVLFCLAPNVTQSHLLSLPVEQGLLLAAIPVIFTSFGFHGSIPAIVQYLDGHTRSLRTVMIIGSSIPLMVYLFWQLVTLGVVDQATLFNNQGLAALINQLQQTVSVGIIAQAIGVFADLALLTSFLGVSLGLFQFLGDTVKSSDTLTSRALVAVLTFTPPLLFALFYPEGFITALGYAAVALVILAIFLPVALVKQVRKHKSDASSYRVIGGNQGLVFSTLIGVGIIAAQGMIMLGILPALG